MKLIIYDSNNCSVHSLFAVFYLKNRNTQLALKQRIIHTHKHTTSMDTCNSLRKSCTSRIQSIIWGFSQSSFQSCFDVSPIGHIKRLLQKNAIGETFSLKNVKLRRYLRHYMGLESSGEPLDIL